MKQAFLVKLSFILLLFLMASCEEAEVEALEEENLNPLELKIEDVPKERHIESNVLLYKHYPASMTKEEAYALFDKEIEIYNKKEDPEKACNWGLRYRIGLHTGHGNNQDTDDDITSQLALVAAPYPRLTLSDLYIVWSDLDDWGDDFEGGWDVFYLASHVPNNTGFVKFISVKYTLDGSDGWYCNWAYCDAFWSDQNHCSAVNNTYTSLSQSINKWLDNPGTNNFSVYNHRGSGLRFH